MTPISQAAKHATIAILVGTAICTAYALGTDKPFYPVLAMGTGALVGIATVAFILVNERPAKEH